jgi:hypothetical protein
MIRLTTAFFLIMTFIMDGFTQVNVFKPTDQDKLPYGQSYLKWEKPLQINHTYVVSQNHPEASDSNPGTAELPFLTIGRAAELLQPGERVLIRSGVYHETVRPARGGESPGKMIVYEAADGETVIIKGSVETDPAGWKLSTGWQLGGREHYFAENRQKQQLVWQYELHDIGFGGYNPFGMLNLLQDQEHLDYTKANMTAHFKNGDG